MARRRSSSCGVTNLAFNQNQDCFACCLTSGLRIYHVEPLSEILYFNKETVDEVLLCEMLYRSNLMLVVQAKKPCVMRLLDEKERDFIEDIAFYSPIIAIRARKEKIAVVLPTSIQVLAYPSFQRVALLRTPMTSRPMCAIATDPNVAQIIAAPAYRRGSVQLLDVTRAVKGAESSSPAVMSCHQADLVCISLSANGAKLATASARGTIIRLWDTATKQMLHELRRGSDFADVYSISFNPSGALLGCVSDKGTLHVWRARGGARAVLEPRAAAPHTRATVGFGPDNSVVIVCEDGTHHKFVFSTEGNCHRTEYDDFLELGDDEDFLQ